MRHNEFYSADLAVLVCGRLSGRSYGETDWISGNRLAVHPANHQLGVLGRVPVLRTAIFPGDTRHIYRLLCGEFEHELVI